MGLLDSLSSAIGSLTGQNQPGAQNQTGIQNQLGAEAAPALISSALANTQLGNLQGLVAQLQQGGLGDQVQSWLKSGSNLPVSPEQIQSALGDEHVRQLAQQFGLPVDSALSLLAQHLPNAVDQASPQGTLPPAS